MPDKNRTAEQAYVAAKIAYDEAVEDHVNQPTLDTLQQRMDAARGRYMRLLDEAHERGRDAIQGFGELRSEFEAWRADRRPADATRTMAALTHFTEVFEKAVTADADLRNDCY